MNTKKWTIITGIIAVLTFISWIVYTFYTNLPEVSVSYNPEINTTHYTILNSAPSNSIENITTSYSLVCQNINIPESYINYDPPILTPITGNQYFYRKQLDNLTINTVENSINNSKICESILIPPIFYVHYKNFGQFFNISSSYLICDKCDLIYSAKYSYSLFGLQLNGNKSYNYPFINPINVTIEKGICYWWNQTPLGFPTPSFGNYECLFEEYYTIGPKTYNLKGFRYYFNENSTGILISLLLK